MGAPRFSVTVLLLVLCAGCAGFRPVAPARQQAFAGETMEIALAEPPPEDAALRWSPGDGSEPVEGRVLRHAWQVPGQYTVTVEGSGGADRFEVEVAPRPVLRAIPASVRFALVLPDGWSRLERFTSFARRFFPAEQVTETLDRVAQRLGADPADPGQLVAQGIDPAEGLGIAVFDFDASAAWIAVGILDEGKAIELAQRLFDVREVEPIETEAGQLFVGILPEGEMRAFALVDGYLLLRASAEPGPIEETVGAFATSGAGLGASERFQQARALAPGDDAIFFAQIQHDDGSWMPLAVGLALADEAAEASFGVPLPPEQVEGLRGVVAQGEGGSAELGRYPEGAVGFLSLSLEPQAAFGQAVPNRLQRALLEGLVADRAGVPLGRLLDATTGRATAALYFDPAGFTELVAMLLQREGLGGAGADTHPPILGKVELQGAEAARVVEQALAAAAQRAGGGWWQRGPLFYRLEEGILQIATIRARRELAPGQGTTDFGARLEALGAPGEQALFLDVRAILEALRQSEARSAEAAVVRALLLEEAAFLEQVENVLLHGTVVPEGIRGVLHLSLEQAPR